MVGSPEVGRGEGSPEEGVLQCICIVFAALAPIEVCPEFRAV